MFSVQCIPRDIGNSWIWYRYVKQWNTNKSYKDDKVRQDRQGTSVSAVQCTLFTNQFVRMCSGQWSHVKSLHFYLLYLVELLLCTILTGKVDAVFSSRQIYMRLKPLISNSEEYEFKYRKYIMLLSLASGNKYFGNEKKQILTFLWEI